MFETRGDEDPDPQVGKHEEHGEREEQQRAAGDVHAEPVDGHQQHQHHIHHADEQEGHRFADDQLQRGDGGDDELFQRADLLFLHDRHRRHLDGDEGEDEAEHAGHHEAQAFQVRVVPDAHAPIEHGDIRQHARARGRCGSA